MKLFDKAFLVQSVERLPTPNIPAAPPKPPKDVAKLLATALVLGKQLVVTGGTVYAGKKILDTAAEIAIIAAKAKLQ